MSGKSLQITILYDVTEEQDKAEAEAEGEKVTLVCEQVQQVLRELGHKVKRLAARPNLRQLTERIANDDADLIFNLCESLGGVSQHEQHVVALLEVMGKRFTGARSIGLALAQDKGLSKKIYYFHGLPYPIFSTIDAGTVEWADDLRFPLFVKPQNEDASIGIDSKAVVRNVKELMERISYIQTEFKGPALIEEFIEGREIYIGVLGDPPVALPILEWDFSKVPAGVPKIASSEAKWDEESAYKDAPETFPTDIPEAVYTRLQEAAVLAFKSLKLRDYGRVDMRLRHALNKNRRSESSIDGWEFFIIEVNPNPYLEPKAEFAMAAKKHGLSYPDLIQHIIDSAMNRPL